MDTIHVVVATDDHYAQHAGMTLLSLFKAQRSAYTISVTILSKDVTASNRDRLLSIGARFDATIRFIEVDLERMQSFFTKAHISKMAYARLFIADLLPADVRKVLYLDTDIIVRHDIAALWQTDIDSHHLASVEETGYARKRRYKRRIGLPEDAPYFNSGVLLINLDKWRDDEIRSQLIEYLDQYPNSRNSDQEPLNVVLHGKWRKLHPRWNVHKDTYTRYYSWSLEKFSKERLEAIRDPAIMHFTGSRKPWLYSCGVPFSEAYMDICDDSPWKGYVLKGRNLSSTYHRYRWVLKRRFFGWLRSHIHHARTSDSEPT